MKSKKIKGKRPMLWSKKSLISKDLLGFDSLFRSWIKVQRSYFNAFEPKLCETSFGYRERPQVSLLGTAVFLSKGVCLQEYQLFKKQNKRVGRNDLWLQLRPGYPKYEYLTEAKFDWIGLEKDYKERFEKLINSSTDSVKKLSSNPAGEKPRRLALAFGALTYPNKRIVSEADREREKFFESLDRACKKHKIDGWAGIWVNAAEFFSSLNLQKGHTAVGLVMLAKSIDPAY
ncbi:MAG TPA: hypothetical protein VG754_13510 [Verrucomicrobiae bacterium]|nr:hypothetical protein [Verrucomicrobiae bacterium]